MVAEVHIYEKAQQRQRLHDELDRILDKVDCFSDVETDHSERGSWVTILMLDIVKFASEVAGNDLLKSAYWPDWDGQTEEEGLCKLANRLRYLKWLFEEAVENSAPTLDQVATEIHAIARGDAPQMFRKRHGVSGRRVNAARLADIQVEVFWVDEILSEIGVAASIRHAMIARALGESWDTIQKWKAPVTKVVGETVVEEKLAMAKRIAPLLVNQDIGNFDEFLEEVGQRYRAELRAPLSIVGKE